MPEKTPDQLSLELFGRPSPEEVARLWGRKSATRALAHALGGGRYLPELPPIEQDVSLQNAAKDEVRRARRLAARPGSKSPAGTRRAGRLKAMTRPPE